MEYGGVGVRGEMVIGIHAHDGLVLRLQRLMYVMLQDGLAGASVLLADEFLRLMATRMRMFL